MENKITIKLECEEALDKKGKPIKVDNEIQYKRDDYVGLSSLLGKYDSRKHPGAMKLVRAILSIEDKVMKAWKDEKNTIDLTLEEASYLKNYLDGFTDQEGKNDAIRHYELRTLVAVLDQIQ